MAGSTQFFAIICRQHWSTTMPRVNANGIQIEYETFGDPSAPPLLLIMGLGGQLIHWGQGFCEQLTAKGHFVIRYDNRDCGLSTKFEEAGLPDIAQLYNKLFRGKALKAPYTLNDLADDAAGLLDALDIDKAHICGASMGGMIAQTLAIRHPQRVSSLISIYSTTGNPELPQMQPEAMEVLMTPPPSERRAYIEYNTSAMRVLAGDGFPFDEGFIRDISARAFDRAFYPQGVGRQMAAAMAQENRKDTLASLTIPTLVIHGTADALVPVAHGKDTADAIPGAQLLLIEGMGHDLPQTKGPWPQIVEAIAAHTQKV
jgi:pimeloyl-ACP methyl ester carboxylesterase